MYAGRASITAAHAHGHHRSVVFMGKHDTTASPASYQASIVAEMFDGDLYASPRPALPGGPL
jgi:hypothetical protein